MQGPRVDGDLCRLAVLDAPFDPEAADQGRLLFRARLLQPRDPNFAHVRRQLLDFLRQRRWRVDLEVHHQLRAERLGQLHFPAQALALGHVAREARILEVLRADAEHDLFFLEALQGGPRCEHVVVEGDPLVAEHGGQRPIAPLERGLDQVHRRAPDEAADEDVQRVVVQLLGRRDLLQLALAHYGDAVAHRHRLHLLGVT